MHESWQKWRALHYGWSFRGGGGGRGQADQRCASNRQMDFPYTRRCLPSLYSRIQHSEDRASCFSLLGRVFLPPPPFPSFLLLPDNTFVRYKCSFISERGEKMWVENTFVRTMDGEFFLSLFPSLLFFESIRLLFKSNVQRRTVVRVGNNIAPSLYNLLTL